jgi:integrase
MRSPGEGSIYKSGAGWRVQIHVGWTADGKPIRKYLRAKNRAEAKAKLQEAQSVLARGGTLHDPKTTVEQWLTHWIDNIAPTKVRPRTIDGYRSYLRNWIIPNVGRHRLIKLTPEHIEQLHTTMREAGLSETSILQCHRILARALQVAWQRQRVSMNVAKLVQPPAAVREEVMPLTVEECRRLLGACTDDAAHARWGIAIALGLRQGEVLGLLWDDVDLDAGVLTVRRSLTRLRGRPRGQNLVLTPPKSTAGIRRLPIPAHLLPILKRLRLAQRVAKLEDGANWKGWQPPGWEEIADLVFAQRGGYPLDARRDWQNLRDLAVKAGVRTSGTGKSWTMRDGSVVDDPIESDLRVHDLRHTTASLLLFLKADVREVKEQLGHSQTQLTQDTYQHLLPGMLDTNAKRVDELLWPDGVPPTPDAGQTAGEGAGERGEDDGEDPPAAALVPA